MKNTHTQPTAPACHKSGFNYDGHTILFVEAKGKDTSFDRWRICLYYEPHLADTAFFDTEAGYLAFLAEARKHTFADYSEFRAWRDARDETPTRESYGGREMNATLPMGGPRIAVRVTFESGNSLVSTINATPAEARRYYAIGRVLNVGSGEYDDEQRITFVEFLGIVSTTSAEPVQKAGA